MHSRFTGLARATCSRPEKRQQGPSPFLIRHAYLKELSRNNSANPEQCRELSHDVLGCERLVGGAAVAALTERFPGNAKAPTQH